MEQELLLIAFYLSILTYYLGVLFYMLPIPFYGVKKWAPTLMVDGIFSASLVFSYTIILSAIEYLGGVLGIDWGRFYLWIGVKSGIIVSFITVLKIIGMGLVLGRLQFLANSIISSLISALSNVLFLLLTLSITSTLIKAHGGKLIALGIMLHSIPFKISRAAGAMIISTVIVFSLGLPLMPVFVDNMFNPVKTPGKTISSYGLAYTKIIVHDMLGEPVEYPIATIYDHSMKRILARYKGDRYGVINALDPDKGIPSAREFNIVVEASGFKYRFKIDPGELSDQIKLSLPNLIHINNTRIIYLENAMLEDFDRDAGLVHMIIYSHENTSIYIVIVEGDDLSFSINGSRHELYHYGRISWYGITYEIYKCSLDGGVWSVTIQINASNHVEPVVDEKYYVRDSGGLSLTDPTIIINIVAYIIVSLFIGPLVYVAILFSSAIALAKLLGGSYPSIMRVLVGGM